MYLGLFSSRATHLAVPAPFANPKVIRKRFSGPWKISSTFVPQILKLIKIGIMRSDYQACVVVTPYLGWSCWTWRRTIAFMNSGCGTEYALKENKINLLWGKRLHVLTATRRLPNTSNQLTLSLWLNLSVQLAEPAWIFQHFRTTVKRFEEWNLFKHLSAFLAQAQVR